MANKFIEEKPTKKYGTIFLILGALLIFSILISVLIGSGESYIPYNTAVIPIKGVISTEESGGLFAADGASSIETIRLIDKASNDPSVKAVIFEINSPGGSPVATDEISRAIKGLHAKNITTVAWIREEGASGAYWIATSTGHIVANRMSVVGSIGVYGSYIEWYGLMRDHNVTYRRLVSGEFKDTGTPFRPLSSAEEIMLQEKLDALHEYFIEAVAENRNLSADKVRSLATGEWFLGAEAKNNGLIDELGGREEAVRYLEDKLNTTIETKDFVAQKSFFESLTQAMSRNSYYFGKGMGSGLVEQDTTGFRPTT